MINNLPEWFIEKYSVESGRAPEVEKKALRILEHPESSLHRKYLNEEFAEIIEPKDTQQERERLPGPLLKSVKKEIDPITLERLANRGKLQQPKKITIEKIEPTPEGKKETPILSLSPKKEIPKFEPGKQVFTDEQKLEEIISQAPEEGRTVSFKEAFKHARSKGLEEFEYKGDRFNTREKGETKEEWISFLEQKKEPKVEIIQDITLTKQVKEKPIKILGPGVRGVLKPESPRAQFRKYMSVLAQKDQIQKPKELTFSDYMEQSNVSVASGKEINLSEISSKLGPALKKISPILQESGITPEITSGKRELGTWSLHEVGEAIDLRLKAAKPENIKKLKESLPGSPTEIPIKGEMGEMWSDGTYEYIIHGKGNNIHLHIERETEEAKERLIEHMIKLGLQNKIPQKGLSKYPNLAQKYSSKLHKVN